MKEPFWATVSFLCGHQSLPDVVTRTMQARKPSLRRVPTRSLDEQGKPTFFTYITYAVRFVFPPCFWVGVTKILPRKDWGIADASRVELLSFTNNYLAAIGLLYAIYLGITFQTSADRLRDLRTAIAREASGLQSVAELALTLRSSSPSQRARLHSILISYVDHVLSRELHAKVTSIKLTNEASYRCISDLYGLFGVFKELASNGVDDAVDLRTLDALHDEVRDLVRARSDRINLTNQHMPILHWVVLALLSVCTVVGVAINDLPTAPAITAGLSGIIGLVIPLSYLIVSDMAKPFTGAWCVSDEPIRGVRRHVLPRLAAATPAEGGWDLRADGNHNQQPAAVRGTYVA
jgi:hypothetical protein